MSPYSRTIWTLLAALTLWSPAAFQMISGQLDASTAVLFFLGALVLAYIGTGVIDSIATGYRNQAEHVAMAKAKIELMERQAAAEERRRATDKEGEAPKE